MLATRGLMHAWDGMIKSSRLFTKTDILDFKKVGQLLDDAGAVSWNWIWRCWEVCQLLDDARAGAGSGGAGGEILVSMSIIG